MDLASVIADREAIGCFLQRYSPDAIQLTAIPAQGGAPKSMWFGADIQRACEWAVSQNAQGQNIYWSVNAVRPDLNKKATKADVRRIRYAHVDIDPPKDGSPFNKADKALDLELGELPPTFIVDSGGGLQAFWRLEGEISPDEVEQINRLIAHRYGGDNCHNVDRIMRVPGTVNYPNASKRAAGRVAALATEAGGFPNLTYSRQHFAVVPSQPLNGPDRTTNEQELATPFSTDMAIQKLDQLGISPDSEIYRLLCDPMREDRSRDTFAAACGLLRQGFSDETILMLLLSPEIPVSAHCLDLNKHPTVALQERAARRAIEEAHRKSGAPAVQASPIAATPYLWPNPCTIPPRRWLYGKQLLRGTLALIVAPGGTGKTALTVGMALALATGQPLLGMELPDGPQRVWLWNLEDSIEELDRAIGAARLHHQIDPAAVAGQFFVNSGLDGAGLCTAIQDRQGFTILHPIYDAVLAEISARKIDVLIVDPFVSSHTVSENDNGAIDAVAKAWARIAAMANCTIVLVHHTSKSAGIEITADRSRGAGSLVNAARSVVTLNRMTVDEAKALGVNETDRRRYFRAYDDKNNRAPPADASDWFRMESVTLPNGDGDTCFGDSVGVVVPWTPPAACVEELAPDHVAALQKLIDGGEWRENERAGFWAGKAIAEVFGLDVGDPFDRARVKAILKECLRRKWLRKEQRRDGHREMRNWIVSGEPIDPAGDGQEPNRSALAAVRPAALPHEGSHVAVETPQCRNGAASRTAADSGTVPRRSAAPFRGTTAAARQLKRRKSP